MIGVSKLLCETENLGDKLRYFHGASEQKNGVSTGWTCCCLKLHENL